MRVITRAADAGRSRFRLPRPGGRGRADARDLATLLAPTLDDTYTLFLEPLLPGVDVHLTALLVGPGGVRAMLVRRWHGHFRHRGRAWEYDARGQRGWIPCRTDPTREAHRARDQVGRWMTLNLGTRLPVEAAVAFPDRRARVELEEPVTEVVTTSNAPWWAHRLGRVRRLDDRRAGRLIEAVLGAV